MADGPDIPRSDRMVTFSVPSVVAGLMSAAFLVTGFWFALTAADEMPRPWDIATKLLIAALVLAGLLLVLRETDRDMRATRRNLEAMTAYFEAQARRSAEQPPVEPGNEG